MPPKHCDFILQCLPFPVKVKNNFLETTVVLYWGQSSFPIVWKIWKNHSDDLSTCRQDVKICKISVKSWYHDNLGYLLSNTFWNMIQQYFRHFRDSLYFPQLSFGKTVGPGLAQLVERLAYRYSESTSSNLATSPLQQYVGTGPDAYRLPRGWQV